MEVMTVAITAAVTSLVSGLVGAIVATVIGAAKDKARSATDEKSDKERRQDEVNELTIRVARQTMWRDIREMHAKAMKNGGLDIEDRKFLECSYDIYHAHACGNGTGTRLYEEAMSQPVID